MQAQGAEYQMHHLYVQNHDWLSRWLYTKLGCCHQAADICHDAFIRILQKWRHQGHFPDIEQPKAYLTTVAGRLVTDHFRKQSLEQAWQESLASLPEKDVPSPQLLLQLRETLEEVDRILNSLPQAVRDTFLLSQLDGMTYKQIAEQLQVSERTVKRYMAQAFAACILLENDEV
ncbi:sigma-70 family RNA polymerase sigma factor [Oceanospirillum sediminis]|uniref:Sigma-70 family RNA polymerase sigma factor n=1 Tax=Oceanospirillum sediminis TaxID=2760088 RepID=A0A839IXG2_9GAMM|nr:sigma-70 family RNA polymerase sigma factor [Oceanospirillum sediminis]MBB1489139.1 sigma-70 family RNA polymerase sigma factor [Oceanospirillum sediminis]